MSDVSNQGLSSLGKDVPAKPISPEEGKKGGLGNEGPRSRPIQPKGNHPVRTVTYFQVNSSDLRTIGAANGLTTLFAATGTYCMSLYFDISKDLELTIGEAATAKETLHTVANIAIGGWIFCWLIAVLAFAYKEISLAQIREEHGIKPWWKKWM